MSDEPLEPIPERRRPETWRQCIVVGCAERVDPREHSYRCATHRASRGQRRITLMSPDETRELLATAELYDPDFARRLLDDLVEAHPNLVATAIADLEAQKELRRR